MRGAAQLSVQEIGLLRTAEKDRITLEQLIVRPKRARILQPAHACSRSPTLAHDRSLWPCLLAYLAPVRVPRARTTQEDRCGAGLSAAKPWHPLSDLKDAAEV